MTSRERMQSESRRAEHYTKENWSRPEVTGLKNRWLAENAFQGRVRKTIIADLLRGLEAVRNGAMWTV